MNRQLTPDPSSTPSSSASHKPAEAALVLTLAAQPVARQELRWAPAAPRLTMVSCTLRWLFRLNHAASAGNFENWWFEGCFAIDGI